MTNQNQHRSEVKKIQEQLNSYYKENGARSAVSLHYPSKHSLTTRSKSYKDKASHRIDCGPLNKILNIDKVKMIATVEPRVTMEELVLATYKEGLMVPVIPELKSITVGGAIMGGAGESSSHHWGCFNDLIVSMEILCGNGDLLKVTSTEHSDIFYGIAGSYGSLGMLVSAEIRLLPAKEFVQLRYHRFTDPQAAIQALRTFMHAQNAPDFLEGLVFSNKLAVIIEGRMRSKEEIGNLPRFTTRFYSEWYFQHAWNITSAKPGYEEAMTYTDYLFRHDQGSFWVGAYLFHIPLLLRLASQGVYRITKPKQDWFTQEELAKFKLLPNPSLLHRILSYPWMNTRNMSMILHRSEKWIQNRLLIQDFCIPESKAACFLMETLKDPAIFPIWLCPVKATNNPEIFAPHYLSNGSLETHIIDIGLYGLPGYSAPMEEITKKLEIKTRDYGGRKILYSRCYYSLDEFWEIYPKDQYQSLRQKTFAEGTWHDITQKVLSE